MEKAVYSRLPGNLHRRPIMARLHLYPEEVLSHSHNPLSTISPFFVEFN